MKRYTFAVLLAVIAHNRAVGYEIGTHTLITKVTHDRSTLSPAHPNSIVPVLGFDRLNDTFPFSGFFQGVYSDEYLDNVTPTDPLNPNQALLTYQRTPQRLEREILQQVPFQTSRRPFKVGSCVVLYVRMTTTLDF